MNEDNKEHKRMKVADDDDDDDNKSIGMTS